MKRASNGWGTSISWGSPLAVEVHVLQTFDRSILLAVEAGGEIDLPDPACVAGKIAHVDHADGLAQVDVAEPLQPLFLIVVRPAERGPGLAVGHRVILVDLAVHFEPAIRAGGDVRAIDRVRGRAGNTATDRAGRGTPHRRRSACPTGSSARPALRAGRRFPVIFRPGGRPRSRSAGPRRPCPTRRPAH